MSFNLQALLAAFIFNLSDLVKAIKMFILMVKIYKYNLNNYNY